VRSQEEEMSFRTENEGTFRLRLVLMIVGILVTMLVVNWATGNVVAAALAAIAPIILAMFL